jgi:hypothetical protein
VPFKQLILAISLLFALAADGRVVFAEQPARANAFAVLVGSNRGGPGQKDLRFAGEDARRVLDVLTEVGGYSQANTTIVLDPGRQDLLDALDRVKARLQALAQRGEPSQFLFYYSGHARARALNMGHQELELNELRQRLVELPATVTVAILDACQSGAISRVKGTKPAADFSFNSVNDLKTAGVAVMASSSASELSQEAEALRSSYFTHHLVVGLRGAADKDGDGKVTLSEAYRYAYHQTLVSTATTAVGKQHVTLETKLRGKGEMVLTFPARASSTLELPARLKGQVLVHREPNRVVMAELVKAPGDPVRLALPAGRYVALLRSDKNKTRVLRCKLVLPQRGRVALETQRCESVPRAELATLGVKGEAGPWEESWSLELGLGGLFNANDAYNHTLEDFRFEEQWHLFDSSATFSVAGTRRLARNVSLVLAWTRLDSGSYKREAFDLDTDRRNQWFEWSTHALGLYVRWTLPLLRGWLNPYVQAGGGLGWGTSEYRDTLQASDVVDQQLHWGFHLAAAGGLQFMPWRHLGLYSQVSYIYAPVIENEVGQTHNSGGPTVVFGIRGAL